MCVFLVAQVHIVSFWIVVMKMIIVSKFFSLPKFWSDLTSVGQFILLYVLHDLHQSDTDRGASVDCEEHFMEKMIQWSSKYSVIWGLSFFYTLYSVTEKQIDVSPLTAHMSSSSSSSDCSSVQTTVSVPVKKTEQAEFCCKVFMVTTTHLRDLQFFCWLKAPWSANKPTITEVQRDWVPHLQQTEAHYSFKAQRYRRDKDAYSSTAAAVWTSARLNEAFKASSNPLGELTL